MGWGDCARPGAEWADRDDNCDTTGSLACARHKSEANQSRIIRVTPILSHRGSRPDWGVVAIWIVLPAPVQRVANHNPPVSACSLDDGDE
jgi:hypothetical protein